MLMAPFIPALYILESKEDFNMNRFNISRVHKRILDFKTIIRSGFSFVAHLIATTLIFSFSISCTLESRNHKERNDALLNAVLYGPESIYGQVAVVNDTTYTPVLDDAIHSILGNMNRPGHIILKELKLEANASFAITTRNTSSDSIDKVYIKFNGNGTHEIYYPGTSLNQFNLDLSEAKDVCIDVDDFSEMGDMKDPLQLRIWSDTCGEEEGLLESDAIFLSKNLSWPAGMNPKGKYTNYRGSTGNNATASLSSIHMQLTTKLKKSSVTVPFP